MQWLPRSGPESERRQVRGSRYASGRAVLSLASREMRSKVELTSEELEWESRTCIGTGTVRAPGGTSGSVNDEGSSSGRASTRGPGVQNRSARRREPCSTMRARNQAHGSSRRDWLALFGSPGAMLTLVLRRCLRLPGAPQPTLASCPGSWHSVLLRETCPWPTGPPQITENRSSGRVS